MYQYQILFININIHYSFINMTSGKCVNCMTKSSNIRALKSNINCKDYEFDLKI